MFGNAGTGNEDAKTKMKERMQTEKVDTSQRSIHLEKEKRHYALGVTKCEN